MALLTGLALLLSMAACFVLPATAEVSTAVEISTATELIALANGDLSGEYILTKDIDLSERDFSPIGSASAPFTGTFDGNGHVISGLTLNSNKSYQGLFGVNNGTIRRVSLDSSCSISGSSFVGAIAGKNYGTIEDCVSYASVSHSAASESGSSYKIFTQNLLNKTGDTRRPAMVKRMKTLDPDIMLLQESNYSTTGSYNWDEYLKNNLNAYTYIGQKRGASDNEGVSVAFKTARFTKEAEGIFWLSTNPDASRNNQSVAWDAQCIRTAQWVVLKDKNNGKQFLVLSTHLDHVGPEARDKGGALVASRLDSLKKTYPNAMVIAGGDFNEYIDYPGYNHVDGALGGWMDDTRYMAELRENHIATMMNVETGETSANPRHAIDHIFLDSSALEVDHFKVVSDTPDNVYPSDHCGVYAKVAPVENNYVGGIVGFNSGTVQRVLNSGSFTKGSAEAYSTAVGANDYHGVVKDCYTKDGDTSKVAGEPIASTVLPGAVSAAVAEDLGKYFAVVSGKYVLVSDCSSQGLAEVYVNGVKSYKPVGSVIWITKKGSAGEKVFVNGALYEGSAVMVPEGGITVSVATPVGNVTSRVTGGDYTISSLAEFRTFYSSKLSYFKNRNVTIHLLCDIDLSDSTVANFGGFSDPGFSFDGHGHTISNFGSASAPKSRGLFVVGTGAYGFNYVRNLTLKNFYVSSSALYSVYCPNAGLEGLPRELEISNVIIDGCSLKASGEAQGFLLSRYGVVGKDFTVNIKGCQVKNSSIDAGQYEHIGSLIGKVRPGSDPSASTYNISDCYIANNTVTNVDGGFGLVCGTSEGSNSIHCTNIGIFNNKVSGNKAAYICSDNGGSATNITMNKLIIGGNTMSTTTHYLVACCINTAAEGGFTATKASGTFKNLYIDKNMTAAVESQELTYSTADADIRSGKVGYELNKTLNGPAFWWAKDGNYYKPATQAGQVRYVTVRNGSSVSGQYANGGATLALPALASGHSYMVAEGNGSVSGTTFTIGTEGDSVVAAVRSVGSVTSKVTSGDYTVSSLNEWMTLYNNINSGLNYFQNKNITIHLLCDIDLSNSVAANFTHFVNPAFSFNGHGHTIRNWGSSSSRKGINGLFYVDTAAGGMNSIKNLKFENCHVGGMGYDALLYSVVHANAGLSGLPTTLTIEGISVNNCSLATAGECGGFILSRYASAGNNYTVNVVGCSVKNSSFTGGSGAHKGLLIGKPRASASGETGTFNIRDCYLGGNTMTGCTNGTGLFVGTAEDGKTTVNITNSAAASNGITTSSDGALVGYADGGKINLTDVLFDGNTLNASKKYLVATNTNMGSITLAEVYSDMTNLSATVEGTSLINHSMIPSYISSGKASYDQNAKYAEPALRWGFESGATSGTDEAHRTARVGLYLKDGTLVETLYASGGQTIDLSLSRDPNATFTPCNGGSVSGSNFTLPTNTHEVVVLVNTEVPEVFEGDYRMPVSSVNSAVSKGAYTISSIGDWMHLFNHMDWFNNIEVSIYLETDLDLSQSAASGFTGFTNALFSFDGGEHTLSNWKNTKAERSGLFIDYQGNSIKNLNIDGFEIGGGYARSILIAQYGGNHSLNVENVHITNSILDASSEGNQMAFFLSRATTNTPYSSAITFTNCSVESSTMKASCGKTINNSGLFVGSAYQGFDYILSDCLALNCKVEVYTGAGGVVIGAVEQAGSSATFNEVGVFGCEATVADTNQCPAVFVGNMTGEIPLTFSSCMAAGNTFKAKSGAPLAEQGWYGYNAMEGHEWTGSATFEDCYTDAAIYGVACKNNATGEVASKEAIASGLTVLDANAFVNGEAAWVANKAIGANVWLVKNHGEYPVPMSRTGYVKPVRVAAGENYYYTNGSRRLSPEAVEALNTEEGIWKKGSTRVTATTLFASDTTLSFTAHDFEGVELQPYGENQHGITCKNGCGKTIYSDCEMSELVPIEKAGERYHTSSCECGRTIEEKCNLGYTDHQDGTHEFGCDTCSYVAVSENCTFTYTHLEGTNTHQGTCECGAMTDPIECEMQRVGTEQNPGEPAYAVYKCKQEGCTNGYREEVADPGDVNHDGKVSIADAVLTLRFVNGSLRGDTIDLYAANIYTDDGVTENSGITTADVAMLIRLAMSAIA